MCLYATHHFPKIAWKPIKVYKLLEHRSNGVFTPCQLIGVNSEQLMRADQFPLFTRGTVYHGIHAYTIACEAESCCFYDEFIVEATIPRFSLYYLGTYDEICSNRLQLPKF